MTTIKATPQPILDGIRENSAVAINPEPEQIPQNLPHLFLLTEKGPTLPQLVEGNGFRSIYGANSLDPNSPFATHQTKLASIFLANANQIMVQRLKPLGAATSMLRYSLEVITSDIPKYRRNADGTIHYSTGVDGELEPTVDSIVVGHKLVWHVGTSAYVGETKKFGQAVLLDSYRTGTVVGMDGVATLGSIGLVDAVVTKSTLYPILDLEISSFGKHGDRTGIIFEAPTMASAQPIDASLVEYLRAYTFRARCVERASNSSTFVVKKTTGGDTGVEFVLKENVVHPYTNRNLSLSDTFINKYQRLDAIGSAPTYGPFSRMKLYSTDLEAVLTRLTDSIGEDEDGNVYAGEGSYDTEAAVYGRGYDFADSANKHMLNIFTGVDYNRVPYYSFTVSNSQLFGGVSFTDNSVHYASGGDDGLEYDANGRPDRLANTLIYDDLTASELANWGDLEAPMLDSAKYPVSSIWDSGFSLATKEQILVPMGKRKDVFVVLSPQAVADRVGNNWRTMPQNTLDEDTSISTSLLNKALLYPESIINGTQACRAVIIGRSGRLVDQSWNGYLPLTLDFADKVAKYMGAGDGKWKSAQRMDESPHNQVTMFYDVNATYMNLDSANRSWDAGVNWVQNYNRTRLFYPAFQTVYPDDTSVLNSFLTMVGCCTVERVVQTVWRDLSGGSYTEAQFVEKSNRLIAERTDGIFDGRFEIIPNTYFTEADQERGYSWTCDVTLRAATMKTVGKFTVVAARLDQPNQ